MRFLLALALSFPLAAQPKPSIAPADYGKWETLGNGVFSPDGKWLAYPIRRADGTYELRISSTAGGKTQIAKFGTDPAFSSDSRWVAYAIGVSEADEEKAPAARKPQKKLGLMELSTGTAVTVDDITAFAFSDRGAFLAMRRYAPQRPAAAPAAAAAPAGRGGRGGGGRGGATDAVGTTLLVRDLASGIDTTFGDVTDFKWQDKGTSLAMTIGVENRVGNGIQLYDTASRTITVLDSGDASFSALTWRKDSSDLAALRSKRDHAYEGDSYIALAWRGLANKKTIEIPAPQRIVSSRPPQWSADGKIIYIGIADWDKHSEPTAGDPANVEVWHSKDVNVVAEQKLRLSSDRDRHVIAAWNLDSGKLTPLGTNVKETMQFPRHGNIAIAVDEMPYATDGMFGRRYNDIYKVDLSTGARTVIAKRVIPPVWHSPGGHYVLTFKDNEYTIYDLETGATRNLSKLAPGVTFTDKEDDHTPPHKPSWGIAGWTTNDKSVIVYDDTDLYELYSDGTKSVKLTSGSAEQVRYRHVNISSEAGGGRGGRGGGANDESIDLSKPVYLSLYGIWTKKTGFAILNGANVEKAVWLDKGTSRLIKAKDADTYAYVAEAFDSSPNYYAASADLKNPRQISDTNPFQSNYAWGKAQLIEYKSPKGERLQGALFYPANYEPGKQYPMLVHIYERESNFLHRYFPVSERSPYSEAVWTSKGYFVLMPDIVFRPRDPGMSILECTVAATKAAVATGMIDQKHMGITGHSWGGYGSTFIMTQTDMFAAGAVGGSLTDLISNFGEVYWNSGAPETGHMEVGQERMQVPLWEDPQAYIRNSAVFSINKMQGPLLMSTADHDGASDWHQTLEFYNIARRAGKQVVMLMYPGENHSLAIKANQIDYHHRILDWFGYYLKGEPAPEWINKGTSVLDREKELKKIKKETEGATETGGGPGAP
ncbi:MAG: prolyl oligopeptidase family serine peptidase [Bryobacteraceae bacterium]|jgi:dipeptidyl aminopeptidase/acylaminoacyl peptidase